MTNPAFRQRIASKPGLTIDRYFTNNKDDGFNTVTWKTATAQITKDNGDIVFEQKDIEVPSTWSQTAINIVAQKYFRGVLGTPERENSVKGLVSRVVDTITNWGWSDGYFATEMDAKRFCAELKYLLVNQYFAFNSPVWFNVGIEKLPQCSACFIQRVEDSMESILDLAKNEGMLFKYGSGSGTNFSTLRSSQEGLTGGGISSGPVSFMRGFDAFAGVIRSGGKLRRSAKMVILNAEHPDIEEFIWCKAKEENKAHALINAGYDGSFNGEAYQSVMFQNANNSVRVTDDFMKAVANDEDWSLKSVRDGKVLKTIKARKLWRDIAEASWSCGDPGIQFDTTINEWNTCSESGRIDASNPCVTGDTLIATSKGWQRIDSLCDSDFEVYGSDCRLHKVKPAFYTGTKPVYVLKTKNGITLKVTKDHKISTVNSSDISAANLTQYDILKVFKYKLDENSYELSFDLFESLTYFGEYPVYDITEPNTSHFIANGIVVHNCSEFMFLDDSACNLASINLMKFKFNEEKNEDECDDDYDDVCDFHEVVKYATIAQEIIVGNSRYPTNKIKENSLKFRPLGLGYANLGAYLLSNGIPYDSDQGRAVCSRITGLMTSSAYCVSAEISRDVTGPFEAYKENENVFLEVLEKHKEWSGLASYEGNTGDEVVSLGFGEAISLGREYGFRNAQVTVLAPTGCVTPDTMVLTDKGIIKITKLGNTSGAQWQDVKFNVLQESDKPEEATKFFINGEKKVIKITTVDGYTINATENHQIRVMSEDGYYMWRRMDNLKEGDMVALRVGGHEELLNNKKYVALESDVVPSTHGRANSILLPTIVTEELAEIAGLYMGNGYTKRDSLVLTIANDSPDLEDRFDYLCKSVFGLGITHRESNSRGACTNVHCGSRSLKPWLYSIGWSKDKGNCGEGAASSFIPDEILQSRTSVLCAFLRGLFTTDGTVNDGCCEFSTVSEKLAKQVQVSLMSVGIPTRLWGRKPKEDSGSFGTRIKYRVKIKNSFYAKIFKDKIGFSCLKKRDKLDSYVLHECDRTNPITCQPLLDRIYAKSEGMPCDFRQDIHSRVSQHTAGYSWLVRLKNSNPNLFLGENAIKDTIFYSPISSIGSDVSPTFDISVPNNNTYIANGFLSHNTIGYLMDCTTTGIEPELALVKYKKLVGGGTIKSINSVIPQALNALGYFKDDKDKICSYIEEHGTVEGCSFLNKKDLPVFDCAFKPVNGTRCISPEGHLKMMAAAQPFLSGAISKTINTPSTTTVTDMENIYMEAWKLGLKSVAVYRDGCKLIQPLSTSKTENVTKKEESSIVPPVGAIRNRLPDERKAIAHKFSVAGYEGYIHVGLYDSGDPGELFIKMAKEGSTVSGLIDGFATAVSIALQYGVPLRSLVDKFSRTRFEPSGFTGNPNIQRASSILDYVFRWLELKFLTVKEEKPTSEVVPTTLYRHQEIAFVQRTDAPTCVDCGSIMVPNGSCHRCTNCGTTSGCS
jgi:ribonucleotide reductase alpha subunit